LRLLFTKQLFAAQLYKGGEVFENFLLGFSCGAVTPQAEASAFDFFVWCGKLVLGIVYVKGICIPITLNLFNSCSFKQSDTYNIICVTA